MKRQTMHTFILSAAIAGLLIAGSSASATEAGGPGDSVVDLIVNPDGTAMLDTDGLTLDSFILESLNFSFTGNAILPPTFFQINNPGEASASFINLTGVHDLGQLFEPLSDLPPLLENLNIFYTDADGGTELLEGTCVGCFNDGPIIPEPSSIVLLVMGVAGLWVVRRRV